MELDFVLTHGNPGAVVFSPQQVAQQKAYLPSEKCFFPGILFRDEGFLEFI